MWRYATAPFGASQHSEFWTRAKVLGGSSCINGLVYNRGNCADYDELERLGNKGSGWDDVLPIFKMFENNALGASPTRGVGGPLHITVPHDPDPLCAEIVEAARKIGLADVQDINESDAEQVGYSRQSVAGDRPCSPCTPGSSTSSSSMQQPREFTRP